jgi:hypothetical protein
MLNTRLRGGHLFLWGTSKARDEIKQHSFLWYWMTLCLPIMYAA